MPKTPRISIPSEVRKYLFTRNKYQCQSCGKTKQETELTMLIPSASPNIDRMIVKLFGD